MKLRIHPLSNQTFTLLMNLFSPVWIDGSLCGSGVSTSCPICFLLLRVGFSAPLTWPHSFVPSSFKYTMASAAVLGTPAWLFFMGRPRPALGGVEHLQLKMDRLVQTRACMHMCTSVCISVC